MIKLIIFVIVVFCLLLYKTAGKIADEIQEMRDEY